MDRATPGADSTTFFVNAPLFQRTLGILLLCAMPLASGAAESWQSVLALMPLGTRIKELNRTNCVAVMLGAFQSNQTVKALELGACGVLRKEVSSEILLKSIRAVAQGQYWVGRRDMAGAIDALRALPSLESENTSRNFGLTPREMQILHSLNEGLTNKDIAHNFGISQQTVKHHVSSIFNKTGMSNRLELVVFSINHGLNRSAHSSG